MAQTLTNERNLLGRQEAIEQELRLLKRMRLIEWGAAAAFILAGLVWKFGLDKGSFILFIGGALLFSDVAR